MKSITNLFRRCISAIMFLALSLHSQSSFSQAATLPYTENFSGSTSGWQFLKWSASASNPNNWRVGAAAGNTAPGLYVSDNNGTTNTYSYTGGQSSFLWAVREISFPTTTNTFTLSFDWRCLGYNVSVGAVKYAYFRVWIVPATFTPGSSQIAAATGRIQLGGNFSGNQYNWINETYTLPNSLAGGNYKLIFEWFNNNTNNPTPANPPAGIDNISLTVTGAQQITSIDVQTQNNAPATITTNQGTLQMVASILPASANQNVIWNVTPGTGAASISATGLVTAQTNGTVWAKAISVQDANFRDSLQITISNQTTPITSIDVHTQNNAPPTITASQGTLQMMATILPATANQNVSWSIIPVTGAATITAWGLVTAQSNGTVWAKAVSVQDANFKDSLLITISNQTIPITSIDVLTQNNVPSVITTNQGTLQMIAPILPATANQSVTWSVVSGTGAASISSSGLVTAQSNGTVWAKAVSVQDANFKDSLLITISNQTIPITNIEVVTQNNAPAVINTNEGTLQMVAQIMPATANQNVTWSIVPGTGGASISTSGLVAAQSNGTVWAKAISVHDITFSDSLEITISNQEGVSVNESSFKNTISLHPVPFSDNLKITFNSDIFKNATIDIYNTIGQKVFKSTLNFKETSIDVSHLSPGNYIITVTEKTGKKGSFFVLKK